ncbi:beta strand repeat-containing protein, partial [Rhodanobacter ginsengisoli]
DISAAAGGASIVSLSGNGNVSLGTNNLTLSNGSSTFAGTISGGGGLALDGGTEILSGANSYSGGTTISAGTLQIGNGGTTGSIVGDVTDNGTLAFDRSDAVTFGNVISGSGSLTQVGSGVLTLTGTNTYTGGTTIGTGTLQLGNGGTTGAIAGDVTDNGTLAFDRSDAVTFGNVISGSGSLAQVGSGVLTLTGTNTYTGGTTIGTGTLQIGNGGTTGAIAGDVTDNGALAFDHSDDVTFAGAISGSGTLTQNGGGVLLLNSINSYTGDTTVAAGTLLVGDSAHPTASIAGNVGVDSGATLGGHGTIGGNVAVASGAHLSPGGSIGTLTVAGDLTVAQGAMLDYEFGAPGSDYSTAGTGDQVVVDGNLTLNGATLNVVADPGFGQGLYNVFSYGGSLTETNGGVTLGTVPAGSTLSIQTLTGSKQINLLNTTGLTLDFWNGNGQASSTQSGGGNGTWSVTSPNWTDATGSVTTAMQPQPGFAIFGGAAGTVTVDSAAGTVSTTGMQFATNGYVLDGNALTLVANGSIAPAIRVGDGSSGGAG